MEEEISDSQARMRYIFFQLDKLIRRCTQSVEHVVEDDDQLRGLCRCCVAKAIGNRERLRFAA